MCFRLCCGCCCPSKDNNNNNTNNKLGTPLSPVEQEQMERYNQQAQQRPLTDEEQKDFDDLVYIAKKRHVKVTVKTGTKAGMVAGLCVMSGVIVAGPVGAVVGGAIGTSMAAKMSQNVVSLNDLLEQTPPDKRSEVYHVFREAIQEEFQEGFTSSPELKLLLSGGTIIGVTRYCLDRDLIESEKLERLDMILQKIT